MAFRHVISLGPDHFVGRDILTGATVVSARRTGEGNLWRVTFHKFTKSGTRNETPHVRVSGKLPEAVQLHILKSILEGTT